MPAIPDLQSFADRTWSTTEIAAALEVSPDTVRAWFDTGGLALAPPLDEVSQQGGRSRTHRLHWRTLAMLLIAMRLNAFGFGRGNGEAAACAGGAFAQGLTLEHLHRTSGPLIVVKRESDGVPRVALVWREHADDAVQARTVFGGIDTVGAVVIDPLHVGQMIWRLGVAQAQAEELAREVQDASAKTQGVLK